MGVVTPTAHGNRLADNLAPRGTSLESFGEQIDDLAVLQLLGSSLFYALFPLDLFGGSPPSEFSAGIHGVPWDLRQIFACDDVVRDLFCGLRVTALAALYSVAGLATR